MASLTYHFNPNPDLIITLHEPTVVFAPWDWEDEEEQLARHPEHSSADVYFHVSSRSLRQYSPWFECALKEGKWRESERGNADGKLHLDATGWVTSPFLILLKVLHHRPSGKSFLEQVQDLNIDLEMDLDTLAQLGVLVNYYECFEIMETFIGYFSLHYSETEKRPQTYCRELVLLIWTSWIFDWWKACEEATLVVMKTCDGDFEDLGLPFQDGVCDGIREERKKAISRIVDCLNLQREMFSSNIYECPRNRALSSNCGSVLCSALNREMDMMQIFLPPADKDEPLSGISVQCLCNCLDSIRTPEWTSVMTGEIHSGKDNDPCTLKTMVTLLLATITSEVVGLKMTDPKFDGGRYDRTYSPDSDLDYEEIVQRHRTATHD